MGTNISSDYSEQFNKAVTNIATKEIHSVTSNTSSSGSAINKINLIYGPNSDVNCGAGGLVINQTASSKIGAQVKEIIQSKESIINNISDAVAAKAVDDVKQKNDQYNFLQTNVAVTTSKIHQEVWKNVSQDLETYFNESLSSTSISKNELNLTINGKVTGSACLFNQNAVSEMVINNITNVVMDAVANTKSLTDVAAEASKHTEQTNVGTNLVAGLGVLAVILIVALIGYAMYKGFIKPKKKSSSSSQQFPYMMPPQQYYSPPQQYYAPPPQPTYYAPPPQQSYYAPAPVAASVQAPK